MFVSEAFTQFCEQFGINHITCPVRDHRGNEKMERLIEMIHERLRTNQQTILSKNESGLSENLYSMRIGKKKDGKLPFEKHIGKEQNTVKSNSVGSFRHCSVQDAQVDFLPSDFHEDTDSTKLVRERTKGFKNGSGLYQKIGKSGAGNPAYNCNTTRESEAAKSFFFKKRHCKRINRAKGDVKKTGRRVRIDDMPSSSESEQPAAKKGKAKKRGKAKTPEVTIDFDEGAPLPLSTSRRTPP